MTSRGCERGIQKFDIDYNTYLRQSSRHGSGVDMVQCSFGRGWVDVVNKREPKTPFVSLALGSCRSFRQSSLNLHATGRAMHRCERNAHVLAGGDSATGLVCWAEAEPLLQILHQIVVAHRVEPIVHVHQ